MPRCYIKWAADGIRFVGDDAPAEDSRVPDEIRRRVRERFDVDGLEWGQTLGALSDVDNPDSVEWWENGKEPAVDNGKALATEEFMREFTRERLRWLAEDIMGDKSGIRDEQAAYRLMAEELGELRSDE